MGGFLGDKAKDMLKEVMDDYGIEPGELYESIDETLEVMNEFAPVIERLDHASQNIEDNLSDIENVAEDFNENSSEMVEAMESLDDTLQKFAELAEDLEDEDN